MVRDPIAAWIATAEKFEGDDSWKLNARRASDSSSSDSSSSSAISSIVTEDDMLTPPSAKRLDSGYSSGEKQLFNSTSTAPSWSDLAISADCWTPSDVKCVDNCDADADDNGFCFVFEEPLDTVDHLERLYAQATDFIECQKIKEGNVKLYVENLKSEEKYSQKSTPFAFRRSKSILLDKRKKARPSLLIMTRGSVAEGQSQEC